MNAPPLKRLASSAALAALALLPALAQAQDKKHNNPLLEDDFVDLREIIARSGGVIEARICHVEVRHTMYNSDNKPYSIDHTAFTLCDVKPLWGTLEDTDEELILYSMITKPGTGRSRQISPILNARCIFALNRPGVRLHQVLPTNSHMMHLYTVEGDWIRSFGYLSEVTPSGHAWFSYNRGRMTIDEFSNKLKLIGQLVGAPEPLIKTPQFAQIEPGKEEYELIPLVFPEKIKQ